jgi:alpha-1,2-mannosyltransferase
VATAVARPFRPRWLANDLGVLAPDGAARSARRADRDLDLSQSASAVAAAADGQLDRTATVRITIGPVRISSVAGTVWIAHIGISGAFRYRVGRRGADRIRDWIASDKQHSTLEAVVVSASVGSSESLVSADETYAPTAPRGFWVQLAGWLGVCALPVLVALYVGATTFGGGTFIPWRPIMVDLEVYRRSGQVLLAGGNFYDLPGPLQFLYPPFAAVLAVPLALLQSTVVQLGWTAAGAVALVAILHRFGLTGWLLSLAGTAAVYVVEPVVQTLAFGQLGIFLVALVVLDLAPGPRVFPRRLLPEGVLTAIATAIKLTPAIFVLYLLVVRKFRAFWVAVLTGIVVTLISAAIVPAASYEFWTRLAHGDTGLGHSIIYYTNQSVMADIVRIFGLGRVPAIIGLVLSCAVAVAGVWAAALWHRLGDIRFAVNLCGIAGLLASPVSWLHHFVWVVPLAMSLLERRPVSPRSLPVWYLALGWLFVGWVVVAPFTGLPNGADVELQWSWSQHLLASITTVVGLALVAGAIIIARPRVLTIFARLDSKEITSTVG